MKRIVVMMLLLFFVGSTTEAWSQSWAEQLGKKVKEKVKQKAEEKMLQTVDKTIDKGFEKAEEAVTGKGKNKGGENNAQEAVVTPEPVVPVQQPVVAEVPAEQPAPQVKESPELTYAKSDFVAGDEIIFEDTFDNEQLGEFPSQWDLLSGITELVSVGGKKAMLFSTNRTEVCPLMKVPKNYLGDVFTMEYDVMFSSENEHPWLVTSFVQPDKNSNWKSMKFEQYMTEKRGDHDWVWESSNGSLSGDTEATDETRFSGNEWHHVAISFNKRAWKVYIDGIRYVNVPNVAIPPGWVSFHAVTDNQPFYITNVRIAKGAVPLYDRMMSDGKFITYGITFDVGKATIKPESMGEINRIVQLMTENPDLKFSVEGHTDSTGNSANNQTLSKQRSQAIVAKLVEMGIAQDRLTAVGKGQNNPIADNSTDEGRAKNRRVEFVKI